MPEIVGIEKLFCAIPRKRFGLFNQYGMSQMAFSVYGDEDIYFMRNEYGRNVFGREFYADVILLSGIYQTYNVDGKTRYYREKYYIPKNPAHFPQYSSRSNMAAAVALYKALTPEQKAVYYEAAKGKKLSGYNLFLREYLKSH